MTGMTKYEYICQPLVAVVACALNIPPLVLGLMASANWCSYYGRFLATNAVLCFVNVGAAFYSIYKLRRKVEFDLRYNPGDDESDENVDDASDLMFGVTVSTARTRTQQGTTEESFANANNNEVDLNDDNDDDAEKAQESSVGGTNGVEMQESCVDNSSSAIQPQTRLEKGNDKRPDAVHKNISNNITDTIRITMKAPHSCFKRFSKFRTTSSNRIRHLVCYNGLITTYGILFLFWAVWLGSGEELALRVDDAPQSKTENCSDDVLDSQSRFVTTSVVLGYVYFGFIMVCLIASYCDPE
ncbi:hypothetical protein IV203_037841 [Nitzschia inconspicua]|uniref:Uncharacterized protein n=1 Tax=Nitzschia inconspicua TaxID=303405 RepID=A0A9K3LLH2_9STRA|nr:hypothetical protein IV203_037841 [Nitzschia inconspicua]